METTNSNTQSQGRSRLFIILAVVLGIVAVGVIVFLLLLEPDPQEVARKWAADNVDAAGEEIAEFILDALGQEGIQGAILKELGGEWIEDRIHEHVRWDFSETTSDGNGNHVVIATSSVNFQVDQPPVSGNLRASVPFRLVIRGGDVLEDNIVLADAGIDASLEGMELELSPANLEEGIEKAEETVGEAADKLKGLLGN